MLFKAIGGLIIIICSTYIGFYLGNKLFKRVFQLKEIERFVLNIENQIVYSHTPFPLILKSLSINKRNEIEILFYNIYKNMEQGEEGDINSYFEKGIDETKKILCLNQGDIEMLLSFSSSLLDYDIEGFKKVFLLFKRDIEERIRHGEMMKIKNIKMYRYMGFSIGAMVVIMIL